MKTVAFIPIKLNNERTPGKNTKRFTDGTPLCHFVQRTLLKLMEVDEVCVYCSQPEIQDYLLEGIRFIQRPSSLDTKETLCGDIIQCFLQTVKADVYIMANATSPFVTTETYRACIQTVQKGDHTSAFASKRLQNFIWYRNHPLNFSLDKAPRTQDMEPVFCELSSPYVFRREVFEQFHGRTGEDPYIHECTEIEAIDIDYPEDFDLADVVYMNLLRRKDEYK